MAPNLLVIGGIAALALFAGKGRKAQPNRSATYSKQITNDILQSAKVLPMSAWVLPPAVKQALQPSVEKTLGFAPDNKWSVISKPVLIDGQYVAVSDTGQEILYDPELFTPFDSTGLANEGREEGEPEPVPITIISTYGGLSGDPDPEKMLMNHPEIVPEPFIFGSQSGGDPNDSPEVSAPIPPPYQYVLPAPVSTAWIPSPPPDPVAVVYPEYVIDEDATGSESVAIQQTITIESPYIGFAFNGGEEEAWY